MTVFVLYGSLFVVACGIMWIVFRDRIARNLPVKQNPSRRDISASRGWTPMKVGIAGVITRVAGVAAFLIWFK